MIEMNEQHEHVQSESASDEIAISKAEELREGSDSDQLPKTCTVLEKNAEVEVYIVGTAHFSRESQEDVAMVIEKVQPHIVFLELCSSRIGIVHLDEKLLLQEAKDISLAKIQQSIKKNGVLHGVMHMLLVSMSAKLTEKLGMAPGGEFRRAFQEAKKLANCKIYYGDRPIAITLQRALDSLSVLQKIRFAWHLITSDVDMSAEDIEKCKEKDMLEQLLTEMAGTFPSITRVFVDERDIYLAYSLRRASRQVFLPVGMGPVKVVGVIGIGHVSGIVKNWNRDLEQEAKELLSVPQPTVTSRIASRLIKGTLLAGSAYVAFLAGKGIYRTITRLIYPIS